MDHLLLEPVEGQGNYRAGIDVPEEWRLGMNRPFLASATPVGIALTGAALNASFHVDCGQSERPRCRTTRGAPYRCDSRSAPAAGREISFTVLTAPRRAVKVAITADGTLKPEDEGCSVPSARRQALDAAGPPGLPGWSETSGVPCGSLIPRLAWSAIWRLVELLPT